MHVILVYINQDLLPNPMTQEFVVSESTDKTKKAGESGKSAKPATATTAERAKRKMKKSDLKDGAKIKLLTEENPRREGTGPHEHFQLYKNGMLVTTLLNDKGGQWVHLQADIERGYIAIE